MNNLARMACKVCRVTNHTIIKTGTDRNQHIAVLHRHIRFIGAMHSEHAHKLLMRTWESPQAHERIGDWITQELCKLFKLFGGFRHDDAATRVNIGALSLLQ